VSRNWATASRRVGQPLANAVHTNTQTLRVFRRVREIAKNDTASCVSVRLPAWNSAVPTGRIFIKLYTFEVFRKSVEKFQVQLKSGKENGYMKFSIHI